MAQAAVGTCGTKLGDHISSSGPLGSVFLEMLPLLFLEEQSQAPGFWKCYHCYILKSSLKPLAFGSASRLLLHAEKHWDISAVRQRISVGVLCTSNRVPTMSFEQVHHEQVLVLSLVLKTSSK